MSAFLLNTHSGDIVGAYSEITEAFILKIQSSYYINFHLKAGKAKNDRGLEFWIQRHLEGGRLEHAAITYQILFLLHVNITTFILYIMDSENI